MVAGIMLIIVAAFSRFLLSPLPYFFVAVGAMVAFVIIRKRLEYGTLILASVVLIIAESIGMILGNGGTGYLVGTIIGTITALLGLADERPKERFIRKIGLSGCENRRKVYGLFYTFGRVENIEKVNMTQSYLYVAVDRVFFSVKVPDRDDILVEISIENILEVSVHMAVSSPGYYYPSLKDMFIPNKRVKTVGVPSISDYFLMLKTEEDTWSFFEEPSNILAIQKEIDEKRG